MGLQDVVGWGSFALGSLCIIAAVSIGVARRDAIYPDPVVPQDPQQRNIIAEETEKLVKTVTELAKELKEMDLIGKLLTVGVLLVLTAGVVTSVDSVASAIAAA